MNNDFQRDTRWDGMNEILSKCGPLELYIVLHEEFSPAYFVGAVHLSNPFYSMYRESNTIKFILQHYM